MILIIDRSGPLMGSIVWQDAAHIVIEFQEGPEHIIQILGAVVLQRATDRAGFAVKERNDPAMKQFGPRA